MGKTHPVVVMILLIPIWLFMLFVMQLICFDAFGVNAWYFYALAAAAFLLQMLSAWLLGRSGLFWPLFIFSLVYFFILVLKDLNVLAFMIDNRDPSSKGLTILSACLDLTGFVFCLVVGIMAKKAAKKTET